MVLADLGAEVIKVERPGSGDDTRTWGPPFLGEDAAYFYAVNRNKRSIVLDFSDPNDLATAQALAINADVVVENFRPGVMDGLGLGYETVATSNPSSIYCSMPAFTSDGARDLPGYDLMMQSVTGFMSITGEPDGNPVKMGVALLDVVAGLYAATAISAALRERERDGVGRLIQVGLFDASVAALVNQSANYLIGGMVPGAHGTAHPNIVPYQGFSASDGEFVMAAAGDRQYLAACQAIGRSDLAVDSRFTTNRARIENREVLIAELAATFRMGLVDDWVARLLAAGVPAGPTRNLAQVFQSPEGAERVVTVDDPERGPIPMVRSPIGMMGSDDRVEAPPRYGADAQTVRAWLASVTNPGG